MWIPTEHEKYGVGKFNLPSYSSKKINCFHSRSAVRACVNVRTGGGEVAVLGCWFPAQLETEWLCFYHEASALFQTTQWWELGFHLTATLQSIRLPASPPPLLPPPPPSPPDLPNATFLIFLSLARALPYFPIFIMRMWTGELFWLHYCCVFAQALSVSVVVVGGNQLLHSQSLYVCLCVLCPASRNSSKESRTGRLKLLLLLLLLLFLQRRLSQTLRSPGNVCSLSYSAHCSDCRRGGSWIKQWSETNKRQQRKRSQMWQRKENPTQTFPCWCGRNFRLVPGFKRKKKKKKSRGWGWWWGILLRCGRWEAA